MKSSAAVLVASAFALFALLLPIDARGDPLFGWGEDALEDRFVDGDIDEEDHVAMRPGRGAGTGTAEAKGESWISLVGIGKQLRSGRNSVGAFLVVGLALDRVALGPVHRLTDPQHPPTPAAADPPPSPPLPAATALKVPKLALAPALARACVAAALRTSGLGADDARIDDLVARARESAWLPETRARAMRLWTDAAHTTTVASTDTANFYDAIGANLVLELRLTWRLDRLLYAGDEATMERVRLERQDARSRLATRTLEALFSWQRALVEVGDSVAGSPAAVEGRLRAAEARATLDVLTGGWFSEGIAGESTPERSP